jgi:DNA-binding MarR family transcriptional regulator
LVEHIRRIGLSALLSQLLVAFTVELDGEFERRMVDAGYHGALSLVVWANLMRFLGEGPVAVKDLAGKALVPISQIRFQLGCLERWGFVVMQPHPPDGARRDGWGSGRGIRAEWTVHPTTKGRAAIRICPPLFGEIERRWNERFGADAIDRLRQALQYVADRLEMELPQGFPSGLDGIGEFPPRVTRDTGVLHLPTLLSQVLTAFVVEFDRESPVALAWCASTLRVLGEQPVRASEIPRLTGSSRETCGIGWQIRRYVVIEPDPNAGRGKVVRLSPLGLSVRQSYYRLVGEVEKRWESRYGNAGIGQLRQSLESLFDQDDENGPLLSRGLVPPPGTMRAGDQAPALGRHDVGSAAKQRMRDLVAQTEAFVRDPAGALPHYPLWDMNRGFGP